MPLELRSCELCEGVRVNADCASFAVVRWFGVRSCMLFGSCAASLCLSVGDAIAFCAIISAADMRGRDKSEGDSDRSDSAATADVDGLGSRDGVMAATMVCSRGRSGSPERPQPGGGWPALCGCSNRILGGHSVRPLLRKGAMTATSVWLFAAAFLVLICARGDGMGELCGWVDGGDGCRVSGSDMADGQSQCSDRRTARNSGAAASQRVSKTATKNGRTGEDGAATTDAQRQTVGISERCDAIGRTQSAVALWWADSVCSRLHSHPAHAIVSANSRCSSPHRDVCFARAPSGHGQTAEFEVTAFDAHRKRKKSAERKRKRGKSDWDECLMT